MPKGLIERHILGTDAGCAGCRRAKITVHCEAHQHAYTHLGHELPEHLLLAHLVRRGEALSLLALVKLQGGRVEQTVQQCQHAETHHTMNKIAA